MKTEHFLSACRKSLFAPLNQFSELYKVLKTIDFNGAGKQPKRCQRQKKRGCFEEAARFAAQWAQIVMPRRCIPSWVISAPSAAALRRLRSETRLRAQSRAHPSLPPQKTPHFIDSLKRKPGNRLPLSAYGTPAGGQAIQKSRRQWRENLPALRGHRAVRPPRHRLHRRLVFTKAIKKGASLWHFWKKCVAPADRR